MKRILILTGAGVSAESGLATFRDSDGLWAGHNVEEICTPEAFARDPDKVRDFYNARRREAARVEPNAAHRALAALEGAMAARGGEVLVVTQNVDDLHERAGSSAVLHMHGSLDRGLCAFCGDERDWAGDMNGAHLCPACDRAGGMRPRIVFFGEMPIGLEQIYQTLARADLFVSIGTSGVVYPAAGLVSAAKSAGVRTMEINLAPSENAAIFDERIYGPATAAVPEWVGRLGV